VEPVTPVHKGMVNTPHHPPAAGLMGMIREDAPQGPLATPSDAQVILDQAAELGTGPSTRQGMPLADWDPPADSAEYQEFLDRNEIENPPVSREGVHYVEGENVDPAMVPKSKSEFDILNTDKTLEDIQNNIYYDNVYTDADIDKAIQDLNKALNKNPSEDMSVWLDDALNIFISERRRRRGEKGGSAGAKKAKTPLEQMEDVDPSLPKEYKDVTPEGGWIGKQAYNIENFSADADIGDIPALLGQGQFSTKRNLWIFPAEPDVNVFDINGFMNRMGNAGHKVNTDELSVLADVLTEAARLPSKRNLSSMAEDLYKMLSGPTKEQLKGQQRYLFDPGTLGFNL